MRKLTKYYMLSFLLSAFVISSCTEDEISGEGDGNVIESEGYLTMSELAENPVSLTAEQGTYILKVLSDKEWTASVSYTSEEYTGEKADEWCILSSKTGINASEIYIGFSKNKWNIARSASVDFSFEDSDEKYSLALNQGAAETVYEFVSDDIKENGLTFKKSGDTYTVNLVTNAYQWTVSLVGEDDQPVTWCSINQSEDGIFSGKGDKELTITAVENESGTDNKAFLKFTSLEKTFDNKLSLNQNAELMPFEGLEYEIVDDGKDFKFNWTDETTSATYRLILAKDQGYTDIIADISDVSQNDNQYSVDLSVIEYDDYIGTVYAKLECNNRDDGSNATFEDKFNSYFDISSGDGSKANPYIVTNARHLKNVSQVVETEKFFKQTSDIDLFDENFTPLCPSGFENSYDGGKFKVSGLKIAGNNDNVGLFTQINKNGVIQNVVLSDVNIAGGSYVGSIAAKCIGTVKNCVVESGSVAATGTYVGGLIGQLPNNTPIIEYCINKADVSSTTTVTTDACVGGVIGHFNTVTNGKIYRCANYGDVTVNNAKSVGGIIGRSQNNPNITECYNKGDIKAKQVVGGIIGMGNAINIKDCYNYGSVQSISDAKAAGIEGAANNSATYIENCYNIGNITNNSGKGFGITYGAGNVNNSSYITSCYCLINTAKAIGQNVKEGGSIEEESSMKKQSTYSGWDFTSVWTMSSEDGYPKLQWEE